MCLILNYLLVCLPKLKLKQFQEHTVACKGEVCKFSKKMVLFLKSWTVFKVFLKYLWAFLFLLFSTFLLHITLSFSSFLFFLLSLP